MLAEAINQSAGVGVGLFIGSLIGFSLRARAGKTAGLFQGSVWKTAVLAGMLGWFVAAIVSLVI